MDLKDLKKIIDGDNSKIIIVENGEPVFVVMDFKEYGKTKGLAVKAPTVSSSPRGLPDSVKEPAEEQLKIEDLPF
ncbi:MAG: hypothetical protein WCX23_01855 [Candidatus Paceibacterota bacterium]|jgi:hypothetical protein|nr:hypothetical protein [Candidatus Paceibacterota bacterium]MDD4830794.1 hypothetical protein [Candidatus Paceibacterota bacterium]MDD4875284.1 hypothetical protein [Candidatus Paceibacterota bacterium]